MAIVHLANRDDAGAWTFLSFGGATHAGDFLDDDGCIVDDGWYVDDDLDIVPVLDDNDDPCLWVEEDVHDLFLVRDLMGRHGEAERERLQVALDQV